MARDHAWPTYNNVHDQVRLTAVNIFRALVEYEVSGPATVPHITQLVKLIEGDVERGTILRILSDDRCRITVAFD